MNYKTYAEAKIANPDCEIVTTGRNWDYEEETIGSFEVRVFGGGDDCAHIISDDAWVVCNPADYCSTLKDFFKKGLKLVDGDVFVDCAGHAYTVKTEDLYLVNKRDRGDSERYILSVAALNGGCKIPDKAEQWTIHNNTLPLCELTDEQVGKLVKNSGCVERMSPNSGEWAATIAPMWNRAGVYRIKPKSERELFIDKSVGLMTSETERTMEQMFGAQFDAGARYKDLTQHFGENI